MSDEIRPKHPVPKILDVASFMRRFGDDAACAAYLRKARWGPNLERFVCPDCGHSRGWWLPTRGLVECRECHHQTSPTAGTVFHGAPRAALEVVLGYVSRGSLEERPRGHGVGQADPGLLPDCLDDAAEAPRGHASTMPTLCPAGTCGGRRDIRWRPGTGSAGGVEWRRRSQWEWPSSLTRTTGLSESPFRD